jgi:hypothetical protein
MRLAEQRVVLVQRSDTLFGEGSGVQQQHRVSLQLKGSGHASYHLDPAVGQVIRLSTEQNMQLDFSASGRTTFFTQNSQQEFSLAR